MRGADAAWALTTWQQFLWELTSSCKCDVESKNPILSIDVYRYLFEEQFCQISSRTIWNDGALGFFEERRLNKKTNNEKKKMMMMMSSDTRSVFWSKKLIIVIHKVV